ncbi:MAG: hydrogenase nickel incorporation protein HypB [Pseudomonadota bacterium]
MHIIDDRVNITEQGRKIAERNRKMFDGHGVTAVNVMGAIGSGKTIMIERLVQALGQDVRIAAIAGDVVSDMDAGRIAKTGISAIGVNTGRECHLDAHMIEHAAEKIDLQNTDLLLVENVGNLVCPADFELGTHKNVVVVSTSEGDDIVKKHPMIFLISDLCVINKIDIAEAVGADAEKMEADAKTINPNIEVLRVSFKTGKNVQELAAWMKSLLS